MFIREQGKWRAEKYQLTQKQKELENLVAMLQVHISGDSLERCPKCEDEIARVIGNQ